MEWKEAHFICWWVWSEYLIIMRYVFTVDCCNLCVLECYEHWIPCNSSLFSFCINSNCVHLTYKYNIPMMKLLMNIVLYLELLAQYRTSVWIFFLFKEFRYSINLSLQITVSYGINTQTFTRQTNTKLKDIRSNSNAYWRSVNQFEFHYYFEKDCVFQYPAQRLLRISLKM